jgi:hypothetical protein
MFTGEARCGQITEETKKKFTRNNDAKALIM